MSIKYLDSLEIQDANRDEVAPTYGRDVSGYGRKIPTCLRLKVLNRWRRVYVTQYSNAGTAWVVVGGKHLVLGPLPARFQ